MKIVIADDEVLVRKGISMTIPWEELGINEVFEAADGQQALDIITTYPIDILLTDIKMPKLTGLQLLEKVSEISPNTVNIVLSCVNDMECVREAMKFNKAVDYIPKLTMNTDELKSVIRRATTFVKNTEIDNREQSKKHMLSFFEAEHENNLRRSLEYETEEELHRILHQIFESAVILGKDWRSSSEWEEIANVFISVGKKYAIYKKELILDRLAAVMCEAESLKELEEQMYSMAMEIREEIHEEKKKSYDKSIQVASEYIAINYKKNLKLGEVAEHIGMSESYFSRYFKRVMGEGFSEYLNKIRIERAQELLKNRKVTMQEAAEEVGYSNAAYFTQIFKNLTGVSPKLYQKKFLEK